VRSDVFTKGVIQMPWVTQDDDGPGGPVYFVAGEPDNGVIAHVDRPGDELPETSSTREGKGKRRRTPRRRRRDRSEKTPA
jgi:hypothetical protein